MNDNLILESVGLARTYHDAGMPVEVLQDVNLRVSGGERIAIVGSSGSGKSTLLHLLGGLDLPTRGEVRIHDRAFSSLSETERGNVRNQQLGFIYQFHHLLPEFTALENVAMPLLIRKNSPEIALQAAGEMLGKVGLERRVQHKPGELSGGERQRVAIARALVTKPQCILADEPTGNLDEQTADQVFRVMLELNDSMSSSLVMVTHNQSLAKRMDRILEIHNGKLNPL